MQPVATWLVTRPYNGAIALALTLLFPFNTIISGMVMAHLVLAKGFRVPLLQAAAAGTVLALLAVIAQASVPQIVLTGLLSWSPMLLLGSLARYGRSVTLPIQVSVIVALFGVALTFAVLDDPAAYWGQWIDAVAAAFRGTELQGYSDAMLASREILATQMTMLVGFLTWSMAMVVLLLGYRLFQFLPGKAAVYGRFADLDLGRVLAGTMAVISVAAAVTGAEWLQNVGFVAFAVFWLQGLAMLHWMRAAGKLPMPVLAIVYVMFPILNGLLVMALAVLGYLDAWFDFRTRLVKRSG